MVGDKVQKDHWGFCRMSCATCNPEAPAGEHFLPLHLCEPGGRSSRVGSMQWDTQLRSGLAKGLQARPEGSSSNAQATDKYAASDEAYFVKLAMPSLDRRRNAFDLIFSLRPCTRGCAGIAPPCEFVRCACFQSTGAAMRVKHVKQCTMLCCRPCRAGMSHAYGGSNHRQYCFPSRKVPCTHLLLVHIA